MLRIETVVVTRHPALVALLIERGIITEDTRVIEHAQSADVRNAHVIGVLPLSLACEARMVTEIPLTLTQADRGQELTIERMREVSGAARTYEVRDVNAIPPMHLRPLPVAPTGNLQEGSR